MKIQLGDFVLVLDSYKTVKALQDEDHGGWAKDMRKVIVWKLLHTHKKYGQKQWWNCKTLDLAILNYRGMYTSKFVLG